MVVATKETKTDRETTVTLPNISNQICQAAEYWDKWLNSMAETPYPRADRIEPLIREWFEAQLDTGMRKYYSSLRR